MSNVKYFYLDMHTLGLTDNSAILSIHLSYIDKNDIFSNRKSFKEYINGDNQLHIYLDRRTQIDNGATVDKDTVDFWLNQSEGKGGDHFINKILYGTTLPKDAITEINNFIESKKDDPYEEIILIEPYGGFSYNKLRVMYNREGCEPPFKHYNTRCLRSIISSNRERIDGSLVYNNLLSFRLINEATNGAYDGYVSKSNPYDYNLDKEYNNPIQAYTTLLFLHLTGAIV